MTQPQPSSPANPENRAAVDRLVFLAALLLIFGMAARTPLDSDLWWHLRAGEQTWQSLKPLTVDTFSFTRLGAVWVNHSWLAEVILYGLYHTAGSLGLSALVAVCAALSLGVLYPILDGPPLFKAFLMVLAGVVAAPVWTPRPEIFTLALFALLLRLLVEYHRGRFKRLFWLPVLFILWANLHGGYSLGLILMALIIIGEGLDAFLHRPGEDYLSTRAIVKLAVWGCLCALVVVINPNGIETWLIPFQTVGVGALQSSISEWASPDFHQLAQLPMLILTVVALFSVGFSGRRVTWRSILPLAGFMGAAFYARRNFGPYALVTLPFLAEQGWPGLVDLWDRVKPKLSSKSSLATSAGSRPLPTRFTRWINLAILVFLCAAVLVKWVGVSLPQVTEKYERSLFPAQAVEWIERNQPSGRMLSDYNWGGYLIWRLPDYPVFVDGRTDLYGDEIIGQWSQMVQAEPGWQSTLDDWQIDLVLLPPQYPLTSLLPAQGWRVQYQDPQAILFAR